MDSYVILTTLVVILDRTRQRVLLVRRNKGNWQGYAAPGGHVDFPESLMACALREVREETGLYVENLKMMGVSHFVGLDCGEEYLVFNYLTDTFSGTLRPGEGEAPAEWVPLDRLDEYTLAEGFRERLEAMLAGKHVEFYKPWSGKGGEVEAIEM